MRDKETSIILEFKKKELIDLENICIGDLKKFGQVDTIKKNEKTEAIVIVLNKDKLFYFIAKNGISGRNMGQKYSKKFKSVLKEIAEIILKSNNLKKGDYIIKDTVIEFKCNYSLKEKAFSDSFKGSIERILKNTGYDSPDYVGINIILMKKGEGFGSINMNYGNPEDYKKNNLTIEAPEKLKEGLSKLKLK